VTGTFRVETIGLDLPALAGAFCRRLHAAGLPVTPARAASFAQALHLVRPIRRRRLYWTARAALVTDPTQVAAFDRVFREVFGSTASDAPEDHDGAPVVEEQDSEAPEGADREAGGTAISTASGGDDGGPGEEVEIPVATASDEERLAEKRFEALAPYELAQLYRLMTRLALRTPVRQTRRTASGRRGRQIDLRRTLRASLRTGGDPVHLVRRSRRIEPRRLVLLCDISGSMEPYARAYLQFLTCAARSGPNAEAFAFATRLTRLTRALSSRNPERAIQRAAEAAPDWSSGTRIGDALKAFNDRHGRRGMARGAVVVILSDGWERGEPTLVAREMARLSRLAYRIVWVNPRVGASGFSVGAGGMRAALPFCDALVSGHSYAALAEVVDAIGGVGSALPAALADEPAPVDTWASATPVPGSSVAMPSGYGPSRGNTTPGWSIT
jgi:uncharacterized protein with von Willebrand factor type A (vWA) domain